MAEAGYVTYDDFYTDDELKTLTVRLTNKGYDYLEEVEEKQKDPAKLTKAKDLLTKGTQWTMTNIVSPVIVEYTNSLIFPSK
ncbi:hypothetical protein COJ90_21030 [Priestia megaterium]|uniref:hypothetical protein n=1 Tax=Priestia megaterium TaxID=1404 RepID=UPI000BF5D856|nr:hypothetical protein [Priestia megaterium]PFP09390.1 hypothetical protein COJ90_21030 [Priestia megaterium]